MTPGSIEDRRGDDGAVYPGGPALPRFSTAGPDRLRHGRDAYHDCLFLLYALQAPIILRQHVALVNARDRDNRPTRNTAAGDAGLACRTGLVIRRSCCGRTARGGRHAGRKVEGGGVDASAFTGGG